jgi:hypothetical protein
MNTRDTISNWTPGISPLIKGGKIELGLIRGPATSERRDLQKEKLRRDGADYAPFMGSLQKGGDEADCGAITLEHPAGVFNPIGEPVDLEKGVTERGDKCYYLTSRLWVAEDPLAKATWDKITTIQKASNRVRLGYSVEGHATKRNPEDRTDVLEWVWVNTVITGAPRNRDAFFDPILASLNATAQGRELLAKAMAEVPLPVVRDFAAELGGVGNVEVNGVDVAEALQLGRLAERLGMNAVDLAVGSALKGSAAWAAVLAKIMHRIAAAL